MTLSANFDAIADKYDGDFTNSHIGRMQRRRVWRYLHRQFHPGLQNILEVNCGTGTDAIQLAKHAGMVTATDLSPKMIKVASAKPAKPSNLMFDVCGFSELRNRFKERSFDMIFSNFAGLNCADEHTMLQLNLDFADLLKTDGKLVVVLLGKKCWVERLYFRVKGEKERANRRKDKAIALLNKEAVQMTYYYSVDEISRCFNRFVLKEVRPVGLFIPPSFLEPWFKQYTFIIPFVQIAEYLFGWMPFLSNYADHTYLVFQKK